MRRPNNNRNDYNPAPRNDPYSGILTDDPDGGESDGIPPYYLKILGPKLAPILLGDDDGDAEELQNRLRIYSLSVLGTSIFFWLWAVSNTFQMSGGFDLGIFSFFGTASSSALLFKSSLGGMWYDRKNQRFGCCGRKDENDIDTSADDDDDGDGEVDVYGIRKSSRRRKGDDDPSYHAPPPKRLRNIAAATQGAVVANYLLGLLFAFTAGRRVYYFFATYCFLFSILWMAVTFGGWVLIAFYREALRRSFGAGILIEPEKPVRQGRGWFTRCLIWLTNRANGYSGDGVDDGLFDDDDDDLEDDIDDELRALYEGSGGYAA